MSNVPIIGKLISPSAPAPLSAPTLTDSSMKDKLAKDMERASQAQRKLGGASANLLTSGGGAGLDSPGKISSTSLLGF
jgi:hypothetical protein